MPLRINIKSGVMSDFLSKGIARRGNSLIANYERQFQGGIARRTSSVLGEQSAKLARLDILMHKIVAATFDAVITVNMLGKIETVNKSAMRIFDCQENALIGKPIAHLLSGYAEMLDASSSNYAVGTGHTETTGRRISGQDFPVDISISLTRYGADVMYVVVARDITELREQQNKLEHQALHDGLTGLPNRLLLANRIEHALSAAPRAGKSVGLMLLDLDRFKQVNDTLGHHVGDWLLKELAKRLIIPVRSADTVARLGGDEFAVLLPLIDGTDQAKELAERLHTVFETPFITEDGLALDIGCSIGIAISPEHAEEPAKLMQCADVAMYAAKEGPEKIVFYDQKKDTNTVRQLTMSGELRQAIMSGQLTMEFQPQLDLRTRLIHAAEGLARWRHPRLGYVPPDEFIQHAEQTGLIQELTRWTLHAALSQMIKWKSDQVDIGLSVNLSAKALQDNGLADVLKEMLVSYPIDSSLLTLEITESALVSDPIVAKRNVHRLAELGVRLSIDDFGTGYSSLALLQQLPLHELKIDKSFVFEMLNSHNENVIVRSTIDLAHNLGLSIVAEGVESLAHVEALSGLNCDIAQGFFISPALPSDLLGQWLSSSAWSAKRKLQPDAATLLAV
jgi:diguanylate cyclase (GGDEF)-like protein/PAS domain S-box-containing protein